MAILKTNRLGLRVLVLVLACNTALFFVTTVIQLYTSYDRQSVILERVVDEVQQGFESGLSSALWAFDFRQFELLLGGILAHADVEYVDLQAVDSRDWQLGTSDDSADLLFRQLPIVFGDDPQGTQDLGVLTLGLSEARIWQDIYAQFRVLLIANLVKAVIASFVILFVFNRLVGRHLWDISHYLSRQDWMTTAPSIKLHRKDMSTKDELDAIVEGINTVRKHVFTSVKELEATSRQLLLILNTSTSGIIGLNTNKEVVSINPAARHMLGGISNDVPFDWPKDIRFLAREDLRPLDASWDPIQRSLAGVSLKAETNLMTRNNADIPRYVRISSALVQPDEAHIRTVILLDDVSEQENHRQQVERASRLDALGQLTGGIAHDFNNLLATILYALRLASQDDKSAEGNKYLRTAMESVTRGSNLTKRLLTFAKRQPGQAESRATAEVLRGIEDLVRPAIEELIELEVDIDESAPWIFCDQSQLENAILNLVLNARDAIVSSGKGSKITVQVKAHSEVDADVENRRNVPNSYISTGMRMDHGVDWDREDKRAFRYIEIAITDDGPGMREEVLRRAVDPFFTTKNSNSGTGLGLSMVYGFIQQSGGELRIYSEIGLGSTVRLLLPRGEHSGVREDPVSREEYHKGDGQTILIVEDEVALLGMVEDLLKSFGYNILTASSGSEALKLVEQGKSFDLLLTDIVMPGGIGGFELAEKVMQKRPGVAIVYMSGYSGFTEREMGNAVAPMIQKPVPPAALAKVLNDIFQKTKTDEKAD